MVSVLGCMTRLSTFSMTIFHRPSDKSQCPSLTIHLPLIASIVDALPETCVNLEIATGGHDGYTALHAGPHLCEVVARVLPRLHHLHLRVGMLCAVLFGPCFSREGEVIRDDSGAVTFLKYPYLKTAIFNCDLDCGGECNLCDNFRETETSSDAHFTDDDPDDSCDARVALTRSLRKLVQNSSFPSIEKLWTIDTGEPDEDEEENEDYAAYDQDPQDDVEVAKILDRVQFAFHRRDIINNKTWVMPCAFVSYPGRPLPDPDSRRLRTYHTGMGHRQRRRETTVEGDCHRVQGSRSHTCRGREGVQAS